MAGVDSAGLGEVLQNVLSRFSDAEKGRLVKVGNKIMHTAPPLILISLRMCSCQADLLSYLASLID